MQNMLKVKVVSSVLRGEHSDSTNTNWKLCCV